MWGKLVLITFLVFALACSLSAPFHVQIVKASGTIYIRATGEVEGTDKIERDGDVYTFTDDIYDSIVVERDNIIIDGNRCTIQGSGIGKGFRLSDINNVTIINTNIANFSSGIWLEESSYITFSENVMQDNRYNLYLYGRELGHFLHSIDVSNLVDGEPIYYFVNQENLVIKSSTHPQVGYLAFINCANVTVEGCTLTNNAQGLLFAYTSNSTLADNYIRNNMDGVSFFLSHNNTISGNNITNNGCGIWLASSSGNTFSGNHITHNGYGVELDWSRNNTLFKNHITHNPYGILLGESCYYNTVCGNEVAHSNENGVLVFNSYNNTVCANNMTNNCYGVWLGWSFDNIICHNNFVNNFEQVYSDGSTNVWDNGYPSGGNYWSDYTGVDSDHDGIGDSWCGIDGNNIDHYPLMGMFSDFNATSEWNVQTICNSSITDFQFNGIAILFNVSGANGTAGFCRICIPKALMNETYQIFVNGTEILPAPLPLPCSNNTHNYIYFNYTHSIQEVVIVPEYPSFIILPLFMIATLLAAMVHRRKAFSRTTEVIS